MPGGVSALISGFTLRDGQSSNGVNGVVFSEGNVSPGTPGEPGGAISTAGTLTASDCVFQNHAAGRGGNGAPGQDMHDLGSRGGNGGAGGAIYNTGALTLSNCVLYQNASGAGGTSGVEITYSQMSGEGGPGGAIYSTGSLCLCNTIITDNHTGPGADSLLSAPGASGGSGGGVWCSGSLTANDSMFLRNSTGNGGRGGTDDTGGGSGGMGGAGGGIWCGGFLALTNCIVSTNYCGRGGGGGMGVVFMGLAPGGEGGSSGSGCGICSTNGAVLVRCTITSNQGNSGGPGGSGSTGNGGRGGSGSSGAGIYASGNLTLTDCTMSRNSCGNGGDGGEGTGYVPVPIYGGSGGAGGFGGGIFASRGLSLTNCTVSDNTCGDGGRGASGSSDPGAGGTGGKGGGIYWLPGTNVAALVSCSIVGNHAGVPGAPAPGGQMGEHGTGGGVSRVWGGPLQCLNTIIALNSGAAPDVWGDFISLGHNLIGVTNGGSGFPGAGDRVGSSASPLDPKSGPLADNGGTTLTLALLPGSPAIDAGTVTGVPPTDQRGVARPQGAGVDIGAFEYQFTVPEITRAAFQGPDFRLRCCGLPSSAYDVQVSTNLLDWSDLDSFLSDTNGLFDYVDPAQVNHGHRFYRLKYTGH